MKFLRKRKLFYVCCFSCVCTLIYMGLLTHLFELDFYSEFRYPLESDISLLVSQIRDGKVLSHEPINYINFEFIHNCKYKCVSADIHRVVYIIKSAINNVNNRVAIRKSWGFENRFSDVSIRTVFLLGVDSKNEILQRNIDAESKQYGDIIQANFTDTYFNNTLKTIMGFQWALNYCNNSKFYFFVDDDFYVSTRNVLQFLRNPVNYPEFLKSPIQYQALNPAKRDLLRYNVILDHGVNLIQVMDFELPEKVKLFAGYVFVSSPLRHRTSKWYVPLSEYPFHLWPPYVSAGAYVVSKETLIDLYYGSLFTKLFRFDDIYLGIVAYKLKIEPFHCDEFYFYKKEYSEQNYHYVIASHGYSDPNELLEVWNEQRSLDNA